MPCGGALTGSRGRPAQTSWAFRFCLFSPKAREAQEDLVKTKEELHLVMTAPPPPPPIYEPVNYHVHDNLHDEGSEYSAYSAEFSSEGIRNDRNEEKRITEAEKNERVQRQLKVRESVWRRRINKRFCSWKTDNLTAWLNTHTVIFFLCLQVL